MYAYIKGTVTEKLPGALVIEAGGVGYLLYVSNNTLSSFATQSQGKLYTHLSVREDALTLYGFADLQEKNMFERLTAISGIGPKVAISLLSALSPSQIAIAVVTGDEKALSRVSGIGKKTAQRIILEMKEKVGSEELVPFDVSAVAGSAGIEKEAAEALCALGYSPTEAYSAVAAVAQQCKTVEEIITQALRRSGGR
ncbi:MAG: Holliday junction branch migration protein RuvA [Christensenellales bacterium]